MSQYDASDMEVLRDLAPIQKRRGCTQTHKTLLTP